MPGKPSPGSRRRQLSSPSQWCLLSPPRRLQGLESKADQEGVPDVGHKKDWDWGSWEAQGRAESGGLASLLCQEVVSQQ